MKTYGDSASLAIHQVLECGLTSSVGDDVGLKSPSCRSALDVLHAVKSVDETIGTEESDGEVVLDRTHAGEEVD